VVANNPDLTRKASELSHQRFTARIASGPNALRSSILFFSNMGIHLQDLLNLSLLDDEQKKKIQKELLRLASCDDEI